MKSSFTIPRRQITLKALLDTGMITEGETLFDKHGNAHAVIVKEHVKLDFMSHSLSITKASVDNERNYYQQDYKRSGWFYWHVLRNGQLVPLSAFREALCIKLEEQLIAKVFNLINI
jgi:hypothetical protein